MYAMTAAHPTLPLPSYARVTNVATGKSVVVRVNDRGPFLHDRVIDLSYAAAHRIGIAQKGSGEVEVEAIIPGDDRARGTRSAAAAGRDGARRRPHRWRRRRREVGAADARRRSADGGYSVQLGAFASYANAQNFVAHLRTNSRPRRSNRTSGR